MSSRSKPSPIPEPGEAPSGGYGDVLPDRFRTKPRNDIQEKGLFTFLRHPDEKIPKDNSTSEFNAISKTVITGATYAAYYSAAPKDGDIFISKRNCKILFTDYVFTAAGKFNTTAPALPVPPSEAAHAGSTANHTLGARANRQAKSV